MARWTEEDNDRDSVDALVSVWRESCLIEGRSLLHPDERVWTQDNFEVLMERFVASELEDSRNFADKLREQLAGVAAGPARLMAEVILVHLLFPNQGTIGYVKKREAVLIPLEIIGERLPDEGPIAEALWGGVGGPGQGFNRYRPAEVKYMVRFGERLSNQEEERRRELVAVDADPWAFKEWLVAAVPDPDGPGRTMRNILLHLLWPDPFERIAVDDDKADIVSELGGLADGLNPEIDDTDRVLLGIREKLEQLFDGHLPGISGIDFYYPPLSDAWDPDSPSGRSGEGLKPLDALEYKKQVVYFGPPGTSKTYRAVALAEQFIRREAMRRWEPVYYFEHENRVKELLCEQIERRQLHPAYSYEDFIAGLRLEDNSTVPTKGHLLLLIDRINESRRNSPDPAQLPWVLILDELNRVDLSRLLGEVFSALDDRGARVELSAAGTEDWPPLRLPDDLFIIGTMNLIDQAVEQLDFALRRRFLWIPADYREDLIVPVVGKRWKAIDLDKFPWLGRHPWDEVQPDIQLLAARATALNDAIEASNLLGAQYKVGHTYFFDAAGLIARWSDLKRPTGRRGYYLWNPRGEALPPLLDLWSHSLEPLLAEYLAGVPPAQKDRALGELHELFLGPVSR